MVKVFTTNNNNKIEFTKDELEKLLNEVWQDGYNSHTSYWWTSPTITTSSYPHNFETTCSNQNEN